MEEGWVCLERQKWREVGSAAEIGTNLPWLRTDLVGQPWGRHPSNPMEQASWSDLAVASLGSLPHLLNVTFLKRGIQKILHHGPWLGVHRSMFFLLDPHAIFAALKIALSENIPDPIIEARLMGVSWCFWSPELSVLVSWKSCLKFPFKFHVIIFREIRGCLKNW